MRDAKNNLETKFQFAVNLKLNRKIVKRQACLRFFQRPKKTMKAIKGCWKNNAIKEYKEQTDACDDKLRL